MLQWWSQVIAHVEIKCRTLRMEPKVNHGPWIVTIYQCRFMNCNKCTIWCRILMWGRLKGGVPGGIWACFTFYTQFCSEPKTARKNKFY